LVSATPITVTQVKSVASDGYDAVQVSSGTRNEKNIAKPVKGHLAILETSDIQRNFLVDAADFQTIHEEIL
jgi:large subunit ribosomal protein L3